MSATAANPAVANESKSSKRKKNKGADLSSPEAAREPLPEITVSSTNGVEQAPGLNQDASSESSYVQHLHKSIRNLRKRVGNTQKVDAIISENPGKTLNDLLAEHKINVDQKKAAENKPILEAQIKQLEEQLVNFKKFEEELEHRHAAQNETQAKSHEEALTKAKEQAYADAMAKAVEELDAKLLTLSRFLRAAAASRQAEEKEPENDAFEGALLLVYGGDESAVTSIKNLVDGDESLVSKTDGTLSTYSFRHIRDKALEQAPIAEAIELAAEEAIAEAMATESDPTIVNASLTEISQGEAMQESQASAELSMVKVTTDAVPEAATIDQGAANAVAAAATKSGTDDLAASSISNDWTEIPRDPAETDTGLDATPAANTNTASWAEDVPIDAAVPPANDGFSEVRHRGGRSRGEGRPRGRGYRGGGRGRGRGDGQGRGRGRGGYAHRGRGDGSGPHPAAPA